MVEPQRDTGTSGRRLAIAIVLIGVVAGVTALFFREFTPRTVPTTRPQPLQAR